VNRDCSGGNVQTDSAQINTADIYDQIAFDTPPVVIWNMTILESIVTGDLFDMSAGAAQGAFAIQYRDDEYGVDANPVSNALDLWIGVGQPDYKVDRQTLAFVGEVNLPLTQNIELDISARHESVEDDSPEDLDHTDYRIGVRYTPLDILSLRASYSTAFIAPSLEQLYAPQSLQGLSQTSDPFLNTSAFTARTTGGSTTLKPEEADIYNIGLTLLLLSDDLRIDFDYKYFDFTDRIIRPAAQEVLLQDEALANAAGYASNAAGLAGWVNDPANPGVVTRNPVSNDLILVLTDQVNAQSMEWEGFDLSVDYSIPSGVGEWGVGVDATYTIAYDYKSIDGVVTEGAGKRNNGTAAVPTVPELKANKRFSWARDRHAVVLYGRYFSKIEDVLVGDPFATFCGASAGSAFLFGINSDTHCPKEFDSHLTWDIQYNVNLDDLFRGTRATLALGVINLTDEEAPAILTLGGLETGLYDPRNQMWYVRASVGL
jgi:iron complex outermembrane receptor protein